MRQAPSTGHRRRPHPSSAAVQTPPLSVHADPVIERAVSYPYPAPDHAYLYWRGRTFPLPEGDGTERPGVAVEHLLARGDLPAPLSMLLRRDREEGMTTMDTRHPVIACGSNRAPDRLAQKYGSTLPGAIIPVTRITLYDYAVCYAATVTRYGAVPATVTPWPGAHAELLVTWLTDRQLAIMNETEDLGVVYALEPVPAEAVSCQDIPLFYYRASPGLFRDAHKAPLALAAVPQALPGDLRIRHEEDVLYSLHALCREEWGLLRDTPPSFPAFVHRLVKDDGFRDTVTRRLAAHAKEPPRD